MMGRPSLSPHSLNTTTRCQTPLRNISKNSHRATKLINGPFAKVKAALAFDYIDNLDAKYEMLSMAYEAANELAPGIFSKQFPLPASPIAPLPPFKESPS